MQGHIINKYKIIEKIGSGTFGQVYLGENSRSKEPVAIKVETINRYIKTLKYETKIYQVLSNIPGFLHVKWFGRDDCNYYMVMPLLGESLMTLKYYSNPVLSLAYIFKIGVEMIKRVQKLHELELIHRDIKPDNFVFGKNDDHTLYLIDFGLTKKYTRSDNTTHMDIEVNKSVVGSPKYASINVLRGVSPSRRDDLESIVYILIYLWDVHDKITFYTIEDKLTIIHNTIIPTQLREALYYCRNLQFAETPDYTYLIGIFTAI